MCTVEVRMTRPESNRHRLLLVFIPCLLLCLPLIVSAQTWTHCGPRTGGKITIQPLQEGVVFLTGDADTWRSTDSGNTWTLVTVDGLPGGVALQIRPHVSSPDTIWGLDDTVWAQRVWYLSTDGGASFQTVDYPMTDSEWHLRQDPFQSNHLLAFTANHSGDTTRFRESFDTGQTWSEIWRYHLDTPFYSRRLNDVEFDPHHPNRLAGAYSYNDYVGDLVLSDDGGHSWYDPTPDDQSGVNERIMFHPLIDGLLYATDCWSEYNYQERPFYQQRVSTDGGITLDVFQDPWQPSLAGASEVFVLPNGSIYAAYKTGLYRSTDGDNWTQLLSSDDGTWLGWTAVWGTRLFDVEIAPWNEDLIFLGGFCRTADGGATWDLVGPSDSPYADIVQVNISESGDQIVAELPNGTVYSTDRGFTWSPMFFMGNFISINKLYPQFVMAKPTWGQSIYDYDGNNYVSSDGGQSWTAITSLPLFFDYENPYRLYRIFDTLFQISINNGQDWDTVNYAFRSRPLTIAHDLDNTDQLYIMTMSGLFRSDYQGYTPYRWSVSHERFDKLTLQPGGNHAGIFDTFWGQEYGYYSHDNGHTVDHVVTQPNSVGYCKPRFSTSGLLVVPNYYGINESHDEGVTWVLHDDGHGPFNLRQETWDLANDRTIVIEADEDTGGLWIGQDILSVKDPTDPSDPDLPAAYLLLSAYPNPFNPELTVTVALPAPSEVDVRIVNVAGQTVATLTHSETLSAGSHNFTFDGSPFASGVYFVRAEMPGQTQLRKVTLLK